MIKNLNPSLTWELAKVIWEMTCIYAPAHIIGQILRWKNFLTLLHLVFWGLIQIGLEYSSCSCSWTVLERLSLGISCIDLRHLAWLRLVGLMPLRSTSAGSVASVFGCKLRMSLSPLTVCSTGWTWEILIKRRVIDYVFWAIIDCHILIGIIWRHGLDNIVVFYCPEVE